MEVIYNWKYREISGNVSTTFKYVEGGPDYKAPEVVPVVPHKAVRTFQNRKPIGEVS